MQSRSIAFLLWPLAHAQSVLPFFSNSQSGDGTYYAAGANSAVNCALHGSARPAFASSMQTVAINQAQYSIGTSQACGMCVEITSSDSSGSCTNRIAASGPVVAFVDDKCPECGTGDLDLRDASGSRTGRCHISWRAVPCPVGGGSISYSFEGSNRIQSVGLESWTRGVSLGVLL
jgi:expansin (peptidoglycan-binding protein)